MYDRAIQFKCDFDKFPKIWTNMYSILSLSRSRPKLEILNLFNNNNDKKKLPSQKHAVRKWKFDTRTKYTLKWFRSNLLIRRKITSDNFYGQSKPISNFECIIWGLWLNGFFSVYWDTSVQFTSKWSLKWKTSIYVCLDEIDFWSLLCC